MPQARELGKDEPHPVGLLLPRRQLFDDPTADGILGLYEANKIRIGHEECQAFVSNGPRRSSDILLPPPLGSAAVTAWPNRSHARAGRLVRRGS